VDFAPALPDRLVREWLRAPTWMAPHGKYVALYDRPLWREQVLSGEARRAIGSLGEIHDAPLGNTVLVGSGLADPALPPPRVPGLEVVGRIAAIGSGTPAMWKFGPRVGVGRLGGHCNECLQCRRGEFQLCRNQPFVGAGCDGGYAEMMLARSTGLVSIPEELAAEEVAPILCAGIATFNALKKSGAQAGDLVAVLGVGGLGHMALQYARKMGFKVVAVGRGTDVAQDALAFGAHI